MNSFKKRSLALFLAVLLSITSLTSILPVVSFAAEDDATTVLVFTSDVHNTKTQATNFETWVDNILNVYGRIDYMGFGGDMAEGTGSSAKSYWDHTCAVMDIVNTYVAAACYTTGR